MNSANLAIDVRGLVRRYGSFTAVDGIDLTVERGECFALLGPNGAGKTTTVEILEGYRKRDAGDVAVLGTDPAHADARWRARIGVVLQTANDKIELTVAETVHHFARYYPSPRDPEQVIAAVGLEGKAKARIRSLSGGQRRRLDVALGIIGDPELLFLDEPTTGFDPEARRAFWDLISSLQQEGTTIVLTTHYLDEAEHLADRVGVIAAGRLLEVATPDTLGGRAHAGATVRWRDADGRSHQNTSDDPTGFLRRLLAEPGPIDLLDVTRPSLEDIYLAMVGDGRPQP